MRRFLGLAAASLATIVAFSPAAEAQYRRSGGPMVLNVQPRSWLDPGTGSAPGESFNPASAVGQTVSYLNNPPYQNMRDRFGEGVLPSPVTNGPFIGAENAFGPIDYEAPQFLR